MAYQKIAILVDDVTADSQGSASLRTKEALYEQQLLDEYFKIGVERFKKKYSSDIIPPDELAIIGENAQIQVIEEIARNKTAWGDNYEHNLSTKVPSLDKYTQSVMFGQALESLGLHETELVMLYGVSVAGTEIDFAPDAKHEKLVEWVEDAKDGVSDIAHALNKSMVIANGGREGDSRIGSYLGLLKHFADKLGENPLSDMKAMSVENRNHNLSVLSRMLYFGEILESLIEEVSIDDTFPFVPAGFFDALALDIGEWFAYDCREFYNSDNFAVVFAMVNMPDKEQVDD